jgi:predicted nucleotidyltransferase
VFIGSLAMSRWVAQDLQELLGRKIDVLTEGGPSPYLQERILAEAASL